MTKLPLRKLYILGGPGSGKTVVARKLSEVSGIPHYDLDDIFWDRSVAGYGVRTDSRIRDLSLKAILRDADWIIEGVYFDWLEECFLKADAVFILSVSTWRRDWRIISRFVRRKLGLERSKNESLGEVWNLLIWNHGFDKKNLRLARERIQATARLVIECRSATDIFWTIEKWK